MSRWLTGWMQPNLMTLIPRNHVVEGENKLVEDVL